MAAALVAGYRINKMAFHMKKALENGITKVELIKMITHLTFYSGWPAAMTALPIAAKAIEEAGI